MLNSKRFDKRSVFGGVTSFQIHSNLPFMYIFFMFLRWLIKTCSPFPKKHVLNETPSMKADGG